MRRFGIFSLEILVSLVLNLTASLFNKPQAIILSKWGWLVVLIHATYLLVSTKRVEVHAVRARSLFGRSTVISYVVVALCCASLGMLYWAGINAAYSLLFHDATEGPQAKTRSPEELPSSSVSIPIPGQPNGRLDVSPIEKLSDLGWTVKPSPKYVQFEIANKPLPPMRESAASLRQLHKPFRLHFQGVKGIEGLHQLAGTKCTKVEISAGEFTDISGLLGLTSLTSLIISQTPISGLGIVDLSPVASLSHLRELNLFGTKVTDISSIANLTNLEILNLKETPTRDLSPLSGLVALKSLDITGTSISDLSPLSRLEDLNELGIGGRQIPGLSNLTKLKHLRTIRIIDQANIDLAPVAALPNLEYLWVWGPPDLPSIISSSHN